MIATRLPSGEKAACPPAKSQRIRWVFPSRSEVSPELLCAVSRYFLSEETMNTLYPSDLLSPSLSSSDSCNCCASLRVARSQEIGLAKTTHSQPRKSTRRQPILG